MKKEAPPEEAAAGGGAPGAEAGDGAAGSAAPRVEKRKEQPGESGGARPMAAADAAAAAVASGEGMESAEADADLFMDGLSGDDEDTADRPTKRMRTVMSIVRRELFKLGGRTCSSKYDSNDVSDVLCCDRLSVRRGEFASSPGCSGPHYRPRPERDVPGE